MPQKHLKKQDHLKHFKQKNVILCGPYQFTHPSNPRRQSSKVTPFQKGLMDLVMRV